MAGWLQQTRRGVGTKREGTSAPPLPRDRPEPLRELRPCALAREGWKGGLATGVGGRGGEPGPRFWAREGASPYLVLKFRL